MKKVENEEDEFGPSGSDHPMTCEMLWDDFLKSRPFLTEASRNNYINAMERFGKHFGPRKSIGQLTPEQMLLWKKRLLVSYSPATVAQTLQTVTRSIKMPVGTEVVTDDTDRFSQCSW